MGLQRGHAPLFGGLGDKVPHKPHPPGLQRASSPLPGTWGSSPRIKILIRCAFEWITSRVILIQAQVMA